MRSTALVGGTLIVILLLLVPLESREELSDTDRWDEVMMYEVTPERSLTLRVPARSMRVVLDMVALVPAPEPYEPKERFPYGFEVQWRGEDGKLRKWTQAAAPRISLEHDPPKPSSLRGTRVLFGDLWGTDPIQRVLPVQEVARNANGEIEIRALPGMHDRLLVRAFAERPATEIFEDLRTRRIPREERKVLGSLGTGLGFGDVPPRALRAAVNAYYVRLDAAGKRGAGYVLRRVQLSGYRSKRPSDNPDPPTFEVGPERWAAINLHGPVHLELWGPPQAALHYGMMPQQAGPGTPLVLDLDGRGHIDIPEGDPTTLVLRAQDRALLSLTMSHAQTKRLLGDQSNAVDWQDALWLAPDVRMLEHARLREERPVCYDLEPGQRTVRVQLRADATTRRVDGVSLRWQTRGTEQKRILRAPLIPSQFESWADSGMASETARWTMPVGDTERVCVHGPLGYAVRLYTRDPHIRSARKELEYRNELPWRIRWRFAPLETHKWVALLPQDESGELLPVDERARLLSQVRLYKLPPRKWKPKKKKKKKKKRIRYAGSRLLNPEGAPPAQRMWVARLHSGAPHPSDVWSEITKGRTVQIGEAGQVPVIVRALPERLPTEVRIDVQGRPAQAFPIRVPVQRVNVDVPAGTLRMRAGGPGVVHAYTRSAPQDFRPVHRLQTAYELIAGEGLEYRIQTIRGQALRVALTFFTEAPDGTYRVLYNASGVLPDAFVGRTRGYPSVRFFDRNFHQKSGHQKAHIDLPPLATAGEHVVRLRNEGGERVWVRALLLGQKPPEREESLQVSRRRAR